MKACRPPAYRCPQQPANHRSHETAPACKALRQPTSSTQPPPAGLLLVPSFSRPQRRTMIPSASTRQSLQAPRSRCDRLELTPTDMTLTGALREETARRNTTDDSTATRRRTLAATSPHLPGAATRRANDHPPRSRLWRPSTGSTTLAPVRGNKAVPPSLYLFLALLHARNPLRAANLPIKPLAQRSPYPLRAPACS